MAGSFAMPGKGSYAALSDLQKSAAGTLQDHVMETLKHVSYDGLTPFTVCDYGSADGVNTLPLLLQIIQHVEDTHGAHTQIHVVFNDTPHNDFNHLFQFYQGEHGGQDFRKKENVTFSAIGRSFIDRILPRGSVNFGLCLTSLHWMEQELTLEDHVYMNALPAEEQRDTEEAAMRELGRFIAARRAELAPGGRVFVAAMGRDGGLPDDQQLVMRHLLLVDECTRRCVAAGVLTRDVLRRFTMSGYLREYARVEEYVGQHCPGVRVYRFVLHRPHPGGDEREVAVITQVRLFRSYGERQLRLALQQAGVPDPDAVLERYLQELQAHVRKELDTSDRLQLGAHYFCLVI